MPEFSEATLHIVAGLLLPIWKQLPQDETRVYRLQTDDGQRIIGRRVSPAWVATTLAADAPKLSAAQVHALVLEGKTVVRLAEGMELHRSRVMGINRIRVGLIMIRWDIWVNYLHQITRQNFLMNMEKV